MIYTWAVELFDPSALIAVQRYCPPEGWLTDIEWGLWPLIEWVGALFTVVFLVSNYDCVHGLASYIVCNKFISLPSIHTDSVHVDVVVFQGSKASLLL